MLHSDRSLFVSTIKQPLQFGTNNDRLILLLLLEPLQFREHTYIIDVNLAGAADQG